MAEYQLPKLATTVRFRSPAPILSFALVLFLSGCATAPHTPAISGPAGISGIRYIVKPGDTLWSISRSYGVDLKDVVRVNSLQDAASIERGQVLTIPAAVRPKEEVSRSIVRDTFVWPIQGSVTAGFGVTVDNVVNKGIDIRAREGTNVRASRAGRAVYSDPNMRGFGKTIILDHGDGYQTVYAYNSELLVKVGESVPQNTAIAKAGKTGRAKAPGIHFEIRRDGEPQNPAYYLPRY